MFLIFSCLSLADLKVADIGLTNENAASSDLIQEFKNNIQFWSQIHWDKNIV